MSLPVVSISVLVYSNVHLPSTVLVKDLAEQFKKQDHTFFAITENGTIAGLIGREKFLMKLGQQFGWALYADKPISALMDRNALIVDGNTSTTDVLRRVVARPPESIYDDIIVSMNGSYAGLVSIRMLMGMQLEILETQLRHTEEQRELLEQTIAAHLLDRRVDPVSMKKKAGAIVHVAQNLRKAEAEAGEKQGERGMKGSLEYFSVIDLLQILVQGTKTGCLWLRAGASESSQQFQVYLRHGRIYHATGAGDRGTEALWKALRLQKGDFEFNFDAWTEDSTIDVDAMELLLEGCRRQDTEKEEESQELAGL